MCGWCNLFMSVVNCSSQSLPPELAVDIRFVNTGATLVVGVANPTDEPTLKDGDGGGGVVARGFGASCSAAAVLSSGKDGRRKTDFFGRGGARVDMRTTRFGATTLTVMLVGRSEAVVSKGSGELCSLSGSAWCEFGANTEMRGIGDVGVGDALGDDEQPPTGPMRNGSPSFGEFAAGILAVRGESNGVGVLTSSTAGDLARGDREDGLRLRGGSATGPKNVKLASSTSTGAGLAVVLRGAEALTDSTCPVSALPAAGDGDRLQSTIGSGDAPRKDSRSLIESVSVCPSTFVGDRSATLSA